MRRDLIRASLAALRKLQFRNALGGQHKKTHSHPLSLPPHRLRRPYAGYDYFGGDAVFLPAKDAVLDALNGAGNFVKPSLLSRALSDVLTPVLRDGHSFWDGSALIESGTLSMYYVPDLWVADAGELDPAYVKPTIGPDGEITYCFAALSHDGADLPAEVVLEGEQTPLAWIRADTYPQHGTPAYTRDEAGGVPILINRSMGAVNPALYQTQYEALRSFGGSGGVWAEEALFLLDLRVNTGGQPSFARAWFQGFTGQPPRQ